METRSFKKIQEDILSKELFEDDLILRKEISKSSLWELYEKKCRECFLLKIDKKMLELELEEEKNTVRLLPKSTYEKFFKSKG